MLDIQAELHDAGQPFQDLYEAVVDLKRLHDLHPCSVRPRDGLSLRCDEERETVQDLVSRFRRLPEDTRRKLPALWNSLAQLEMVIGDLEASLADFQEVSRLVQDPVSRGEAHHNVYRAALERRDWDTALVALRRAVVLDPDTFEPFPSSRYEPLQILGATGLGVSFLCRDREAGAVNVVVQALRTDCLERPAVAVLAEARILREIDHPALVRILDAGTIGPEDSGSHAAPRPYLVLEHFEGEKLTDYVAREGPFTPEDWLDVAWPIARALQFLHGHGVLHRSLSPDAILVRPREAPAGQPRLAVKVLDTSLSLSRASIHACASIPESARRTSLGRTVARLVPYSPPEVIGRPKGQVWVGPHSDVYSFGKLCAFGLTGRPDPDASDQLLLSDNWRSLLQDMTAWTINRRPPHMGLILDQMSEGTEETRVPGIERALHEGTIEALSRRLEADPEDLDALLQRGAAHFRQGAYDLAVSDYARAVELQPEQANLRLRRAQALVRVGKVDEAIQDYSEALRLEPGNLEALGNRGLAHAQKELHDQAIADYTAGLRLEPHDDVLLFNRGNAHYCKREYEQAIADYSAALRIQPNGLSALGNRAKAYMVSGHPARAIADLSRLLQLDPTNVKPLTDRAACQIELLRHDRAIEDYTEAIRLTPTAPLFHLRGLAHESRRDAAAALADYARALEYSPDNGAVLLSRARLLTQQSRFDEALEDLARVLEQTPRSIAALTQRGAIHSRMGKHVEAVADLTEAIGLAPSTWETFFHRGNAHLEAGDLDRAIADFGEVLRIEPRYVPAYCNRGGAYNRLGEPERALADFERAVELDPNDLISLHNRAGTHLRLGNIDRALADYNEVLRLDPANARTSCGRGLLFAGQGELDRALEDFDRTILLEPDNGRAHHHRGNVRAERGEWDRALADYSEAIRLEPGYLLAWYNRGIAHLETGDLPGAIGDFDEALKLDPGNSSALVNRGLARRRHQDVEGALADFSAAIAQDGACLPALFNRASIHSERGELQAALADFDRVLEEVPMDVGAYISRGQIHGRLGSYALALADNLKAFEFAPKDPRVLNNLSWLLATAPEESIRDGARALELALLAVENDEDATRLDTLAAAYAACGRFEEAAAKQGRAMELCEESEKEDFRSRLVLYEAGRAYLQERPPHVV